MGILANRKRKKREAAKAEYAAYAATQYGRLPAMEGDWCKNFLGKDAQAKTRTVVGGNPIVGSGIHHAMHRKEKRPLIERVYDRNGYVGLAIDQQRLKDIRETVKVYVEDPLLIGRVLRNKVHDKHLAHQVERDTALFV